MEQRQAKRPNFTEAECLALANGVRQFNSIINSPHNSVVTNEAKQAKWKEICQLVNATSMFQRTVRECKRKYSNIKTVAKKGEAHNRKELGKTGGGSATIIKLKPAEEILVSTMHSSSIVGVEGGIDVLENSK